MELLSLEQAWTRLSRHIEWSERFWLLFVFTDDPRVIDALRSRMRGQLELGKRELVSLRAVEPGDSGVVERLLEGQARGVAVVDFVRHGEDWRGAWEQLCAQLNQRREVLIERWAGGGIVLATTLDRVDDTPAAAPDLWTIRALLLRVAGLPSEGVEPGFVGIESPERERPVGNVELARQAVDRARRLLGDAELVESLTGLAEAAEGEEALAAANEGRELALRMGEEAEVVGGCLVRLGPVFGRVGERELGVECVREGISRLEDVYGTRERVEIAEGLLALAEVMVPRTWASGYPMAVQMEALAATQEAVDLCRMRVDSEPDVVLPLLGKSLNQLGVRLHALGQMEGALSPAREAIDAFEKLVSRNPDAFLPDLASSLNNIGVFLQDLGRTEDSLGFARQSVDIYRKLASNNADAYLSDLALSLQNLGLRLHALGRWEEALTANQESVDIYMYLVSRNPDAFLPMLAWSLNSLSLQLHELGRKEEALAFAQQSVDIQKKLASSNPDAFLPMLAQVLNNLGLLLNALGRREDALAPAQEAVDIQRKLASSNPDAFLSKLAASLNNLGADTAALGQHLRARDHHAEALAAILPYFVKHPAAYAEVASQAALALDRLETQHGAAIPDALAPVVDHFLQYTEAGPPEWTEANLRRAWEFVRLYVQEHDLTPDSPTPDPAPIVDDTPPSSLALRWVIMIAVVIIVLALAKRFA